MGRLRGGRCGRGDGFHGIVSSALGHSIDTRRDGLSRGFSVTPIEYIESGL